MGLALELEDREVAVALEHQAGLVVGRADPLLREQRLARGDVRDPLGLVFGPRHCLRLGREEGLLIFNFEEEEEGEV